jgi:peptidoglycan/LPS O-acetylase OafA/YrhL
MGVMRLMLSLLVVGSHVGGMGEVPSGATAIAGFFTISGFLMARTIFENYSTAGAASTELCAFTSTGSSGSSRHLRRSRC